MVNTSQKNDETPKLPQITKNSSDTLGIIIINICLLKCVNALNM